MEMETGSQSNLASRFNLDRFRDPKILAASAFIGGLIIGLMLLGWWLFPVQWTDASAEQLRSDLQVDYLRMAVDSYSVNGDKDLAASRLSALGLSAADVIQQVSAAPGDQDEDSLAYFQNQSGVAPVADSAEQELVPLEQTPAEEGLFGSSSLLLTMCAVTAILGVALAGLYYFRNRQGGGGALKRQTLENAVQSSALDALGDTPPISQWMTTYLMGDDLFDDSFSIDSSNGEFLGECGVGIAETVGVGDPKRVSSFELWLFDKNDIQTVTKVLMSNHAFSEDATRERLSAKGEPILAQPGSEAVLETETLQLVVRVVDMEYGEGPMPEESYFDRVTLELAVWSKE